MIESLPERLVLRSTDTDWASKVSLCVAATGILGNHPKAAIDYHLKTGHRETA
jgi:hypothetical protein